MWTSKIGTWWPRDHTVSGDAAEEVSSRPAPGAASTNAPRPAPGTNGARSPSGSRPAGSPISGTSGASAPRRPRWRSPSSTRAAPAPAVEIEHTGWEALGDDAEVWRDKNRGGWDALLPHFVAAVTEGS